MPASNFVIAVLWSLYVGTCSSRRRISVTTHTSTAPHFHRSQLLWPVLAALLILGWSSGFVGIRYVNEEASVALLLFWRTLLGVFHLDQVSANTMILLHIE
jgi:hypothetical protein